MYFDEEEWEATGSLSIGGAKSKFVLASSITIRNSCTVCPLLFLFLDADHFAYRNRTPQWAISWVLFRCKQDYQEYQGVEFTLYVFL